MKNFASFLLTLLLLSFVGGAAFAQDRVVPTEGETEATTEEVVAEEEDEAEEDADEAETDARTDNVDLPETLGEILPVDFADE